MLEGTWEHQALHEGLAQYHFPDSILKLFMFRQDWPKKKRFLGGMVKVLFVCHAM